MPVLAAMVLSCGSSSANQEIAQTAEEPLARTLPPDLAAIWVAAEEVSTPEQIDSWANGLNDLRADNQMEIKGPYTIIRDGKGYEVTASLVGGEIVMLYAQVGDGSEQYWYYLNEYDVSTLREMGRTFDGTHYERRFYYTIGAEGKRLLKAVERRAAQQSELTSEDYVLYQPAEENDFRLDPLAVRNSAISFIQGK